MKKIFSNNVFPDSRLLMIAMLISILGLVMVGSATSEISAQKYGGPTTLVTRHFFYLLVALIMYLVLSRISFSQLAKLRFPAIISTVILLLLVFVPGLGKQVNGSNRWLDLVVISVQPSEIAKIAMILFLSVFLGKLVLEIQDKNGAKTLQRSMNLSSLMPAIILILIVGTLILIEPDFGTTLVLCATSFGMIFVAGMQYRLVLLGIVVSALLFAFLFYLHPYRIERFYAVINPWDHAFDSGYQATQALMAIGRGGWFGVGLGKSVQKFFYLPEAHTDFLVAVTIEELGLLSCLFLIVLYAVLILKIASIARRAMLAGQVPEAIFSYGVYFYLCLQSAVALGVNLTLLPTTGISLPLFSYGGSSLIISYAMLGITSSIEKSIGKLKVDNSKTTSAEVAYG